MIPTYCKRYNCMSCLLFISFVLFCFSCSAPAAEQAEAVALSEPALIANKALQAKGIFFANGALAASLPAFARPALVALSDSFLLDSDHIIYGDFNADNKEDLASKITNLQDGKQGVLIIHNAPEQEYHLFGAGRPVNGTDDLDWIDIFKTLPKGETVAPTLVDAKTGKILGEDKAKAVKLTGNGILLYMNEAYGGGIIYWTGSRYEWLHLE